MQSRSVQSRIRSRQNSVACRSRLRILACKSRVRAFAPESCSYSLMLSPVVFFFLLRVLIQLTMCSSHGSKDRDKCSVVRESVSCLFRCRYGRGRRTTTRSGTWPALQLSLK
ncbi:unnamed protein product [Sphagnum balticum]